MTEHIMQELATIQAAIVELTDTVNGLATSHVLYPVLLQELAQLHSHIAALDETTKNL